MVFLRNASLSETMFSWRSDRSTLTSRIVVLRTTSSSSLSCGRGRHIFQSRGDEDEDEDEGLGPGQLGRGFEEWQGTAARAQSGAAGFGARPRDRAREVAVPCGYGPQRPRELGTPRAAGPPGRLTSRRAWQSHAHSSGHGGARRPPCHAGERVGEPPPRRRPNRGPGLSPRGRIPPAPHLELFDGDDLLGLLIAALQDDAVGPLADDACEAGRMRGPDGGGKREVERWCVG